MGMTSLKISKKEAKSEAKLASPYMEQERYPYGLRLDLNDETLKKLGITSLPAVGGTIMFEAKAKVVGSRQSATQDSENRSIELQITDIDIDFEGDEEVKEGELTRGEAGAMSRVAKKMRSL
jgi:hypothetical protein